MSKNKPDFIVYGESLGGHWKRMGVAWRSTARDPDKTSFVSIKLDFIPNTGQLTLWKAGDRPEDLELNEKQEEKSDGKEKA